MTVNPIGGPDLGASVALRRWMDAIAAGRPGEHVDAQAARVVAGASPAEVAGVGPLGTRAGVADLVPHADAHRLDPAALDAHAAVGELTTQRDTYVRVEEVLARAGERLSPVLADVDRAYAAAALRGPSRADAAAARTDVFSAVSAATREFAATDRRMAEVAGQAQQAVRDTITRADDLAEQIAADNRARAGANAPADDAALRRRDVAVRELGRLIGATATPRDDGGIDVHLGDRALVRGGVVDPLVADASGTSGAASRLAPGATAVGGADGSARSVSRGAVDGGRVGALGGAEGDANRRATDTTSRDSATRSDATTSLRDAQAAQAARAQDARADAATRAAMARAENARMEAQAVTALGASGDDVAAVRAREQAQARLDAQREDAARRAQLDAADRADAQRTRAADQAADRTRQTDEARRDRETDAARDADAARADGREQSDAATLRERRAEARTLSEAGTSRMFDGPDESRRRASERADEIREADRRADDERVRDAREARAREDAGDDAALAAADRRRATDAAARDAAARDAAARDAAAQRRLDAVPDTDDDRAARRREQARRADAVDAVDPADVAQEARLRREAVDRAADAREAAAEDPADAPDAAAARAARDLYDARAAARADDLTYDPRSVQARARATEPADLDPADDRLAVSDRARDAARDAVSDRVTRDAVSDRARDAASDRVTRDAASDRVTRDATRAAAEAADLAGARSARALRADDPATGPERVDEAAFRAAQDVSRAAARRADATADAGPAEAARRLLDDPTGGRDGGGVRFASGAPADGVGGVLAATVAAARTAAPAAREVLAGLMSAFATEVGRRQGALDATDPTTTTTTAANAAANANAPDAASLVRLRAGRLDLVGGPDDVVLPDRTPRPTGPTTATTPAVPSPNRATNPSQNPAPSPLDATSIADAQGRFAAGAAGVLSGLLDEVGERRVRAERTLDVLSVVDAVLSGAPTSQVGGLVRASLGAVEAPASGPSRGGQELVSSLQALNTATVALGDSVAGLADRPATSPLQVTAGDAEAVTAVPVTPGNAGNAGAGRQADGVFGGLLGAVASLFGAAPARSTPTPPFDASLEVLSVARTFGAAGATTFPAGALLGGGRPFDLAVTDHAGGEVTRRDVTIGPGTTLAGLAATLDGLGTSARFSVAAAGAGRERLMVTGRAPGDGAQVEVTGPDGAPSPVLGEMRVLDAGEKTAVRVSRSDGEEFVATADGTVVDGALPGMRLLVAPGAAGSTLDVRVHPDAAALADQVARFGVAAGAMLATLAGRAAIPPAAANVLRSDAQVSDLMRRVEAVVSGTDRPSGHGVESGTGGGVGSGAGGGQGTGGHVGSEGGNGTARRGVPGLHLAGRDARERVEFDRETFLRALADAPEAVTESVRRLGREVTALTQDATDLRTGFLPVRILGEQSLVQDYSTRVRLEEREGPREEVVARRQEAMQSLVDLLDAQRTWLSGQLA